MKWTANYKRGYEDAMDGRRKQEKSNGYVMGYDRAKRKLKREKSSRGRSSSRSSSRSRNSRSRGRAVGRGRR